VILNGEQQLSGSPEQIWELLLNPDVLASIMPGCDSLERIEVDRYKGSIKAKIGPVSSQYNAEFQIQDKEPPHRYRLLIDGQGPGGFMKGDTVIELKPNEEGTVLAYSGTASVGGKIASIGQRLVETGAKLIIKQGFKALKKEVDRKIA
jgi:carbon monoxide dehydrogenase subunit G